jgi:tetratricopeptide (TPR) repeat protein
MSRTIVLFLAFLAVGCRREGVAAEKHAGGSASAEPQLDDKRRLALQAVKGERHVDKQITALQEKAKSQRDKLEWWFLLGQAWVQKARESSDPGFYLNANACAEIALEIDSKSPMALNLLGMVLLNDHKFREARDVANQILSIRTDEQLAYGLLSDAQLELGNFDQAVEAAEKMVSLKPNLPSYARASYLRWLQGDAAGAKTVIRSAIDAGSKDQRDPEPRTWTMVQAAMLFWHEGDYEGADAGFDLALKSMSDYPPALVGKGRVAMAKGEGKRAAELFDKAYQQSPLVETAWLLGDARSMAGDAQGAKAAYDLVVKNGKSDPRTLALFYATMDRDKDEALRLATEEKKTRGDLYTLDAYAFAAYRAGKLDEARTASDAALKLGTRDAKLLYHAGAIRLAAGDAEGGKKLLREALAYNPKFDYTGAADAARLSSK